MTTQGGSGPPGPWGPPDGGQAATPHPGASSPNQPHQGQPHQGQPHQGSSYPGAAYPGASYPGSSHPGQQYPGQQYPGSPYAGPQTGGFPAAAPGHPWGSPPGQPSGAVPDRGRGAGRRGRRMALLVVALVVVTGLVVLALLAFVTGPRFARVDVLDASAVERGVTDVVTRDWRRTVSGVACPEGVRARAGESFRCSATVDGRPRQVPVDVLDGLGTYQVGQPR